MEEFRTDDSKGSTRTHSLARVLRAILVGGGATLVLMWVLVGVAIMVPELLRNLRYYAHIRDLESTDMYGGATPEETISLILAAFHSGNLELASRYCSVERQARVLYGLEVSAQSGVLADDIATFERKTTHWRLVRNDGKEAVYRYHYRDECSVLSSGRGVCTRIFWPPSDGEGGYVPGGGILEDVFKLNPTTRVWKYDDCIF